MSNPETMRDVYVILPYLKTSEPIDIRGITFRSSKDLKGLPQHVARHFKQLFQMFYLRDNLKVKLMCFAYLHGRTDEVRQMIKQVKDAQSLIAYLYGSTDRDGRPDFPSEQATVYVLEAKEETRSWAEAVIKSDDQSRKKRNVVDLDNEFIDQYYGYVNWIHYVTAISGSRFYPEKRHLMLNLHQDIAIDLARFRHFRGNEEWCLIRFLTSQDRLITPLENRILIAIDWFNRSNRLDQFEDINLLFLAVAFESLLGLEAGTDLTNRFKETVTTLLGSISRLDSWLEQFYRERSRIVHEGYSRQLEFIPADAKELANIRKKNNEVANHRPLTSYGYVIFRLCLNAILTGHYLAQTEGLSSFLQPNQQRLEEICKTLSKSEIDSKFRFREVKRKVDELNLYRSYQYDQINLDTLLGATKLIASIFLGAHNSLSTELSQAIAQLVKTDIDRTARLQILHNSGSLITELQRYGEFDPNHWDEVQTFCNFLQYAKLVIPLSEIYQQH